MVLKEEGFEFLSNISRGGSFYIHRNIIPAGADPAQNLTYAQDRVGGGLGAKPPENLWGPRPFYHGKRPYSLETRLEISFIYYLVS